MPDEKAWCLEQELVDVQDAIESNSIQDQVDLSRDLLGTGRSFGASLVYGFGGRAL